MGSPVTLSGFNSIDFNLILTSIMTQESQPLVALQSRQSALETRLKTLSTLTSRISSLESAADALSSTKTNTLEAAIPGATLTLLKKNTSPTVVEVAADPSALKNKIKTFISSYNDLMKFANDQRTSASNGDQASLGRDPLLTQLRNTMSQAFGPGSAARYVSQVGIEFTQTGTLELDEEVFNDAVENGFDLASLFVGTDASPGAFKTIGTMLDAYTQANGFISGARQQLTAKVSRLTGQVSDMQARLAVRRASLQQEFIAADQALSRLKAQSGSLASIGGSIYGEP